MVQTKKSKGLLKRIKKFLPIYVLALPGLVYLLINYYVPMAGLVVAFKNYSSKKGIWGSDWAGLKVYKYLIT